MYIRKMRQLRKKMFLFWIDYEELRIDNLYMYLYF